MTIKYIQTDKAPSAIGAYSQAVKLDNTIYLSGQIPLTPEKMEIVSEDIEIQIKQVFVNLSHVLDASGSSLNKILKLNVYLTDLSHFSLVNKHMESIFEKPYPARAAIGINKLPKDALIEIDAIATTK
tara:strand:- start:3992 stop:4375 length:384 start_codon:yes stop_codon:yes gene_type:complete